MRVVALGRIGYSPLAYPFVWDWGSLLFFLATGAAAVPVIAYLAQVLYASGARKEGQDPAPGVERFGDLGVRLLIAWFVFYLGLGLFVVARNLGG